MTEPVPQMSSPVSLEAHTSLEWCRIADLNTQPTLIKLASHIATLLNLHLGHEDQCLEVMSGQAELLAPAIHRNQGC